MTDARTLEIVNTIWKQINIQTKMACGCRQATIENGTLRMRVGGRAYRLVIVELNGLDLYNISYVKVTTRGQDYGKRTVLESVENAYVEDMNEIIYHMCNK